MARGYYVDPTTGRRTTRAVVVHRLALVARRLDKWDLAADAWQDKAVRARSKAWATRFAREAARAQRHAHRAAVEAEAWTHALTRGDGAPAKSKAPSAPVVPTVPVPRVTKRPARQVQYRLSVSYTRKAQRVQVDVLFRKGQWEEATDQEVASAFAEFRRTQGTPPPGWEVRGITWFHETTGKQGTKRTARDKQQVVTGNLWAEGFVPFRKVFNHAEEIAIGEERKPPTLGREWIIGEEEV